MPIARHFYVEYKPRYCWCSILKERIQEISQTKQMAKDWGANKYQKKLNETSPNQNKTKSTKNQTKPNSVRVNRIHNRWEFVASDTGICALEYTNPKIKWIRRRETLGSKFIWIYSFFVRFCLNLFGETDSQKRVSPKELPKNSNQFHQKKI